MKTKEALKNTYIEIKGNLKLSKAVQEKLFGMGFEWLGSIKSVNGYILYIFLESDYTLSHDCFINSNYTQIFPSDLGLTDDGEELPAIEKEPDTIAWDEPMEMLVWDYDEYMEDAEIRMVYGKFKGQFIVKIGDVNDYNSFAYAKSITPNKTTLKLTLPQALQQLAELNKVDSIEIINE